MYLLIAYKENSTDYCRGCVMAHYSSDHKLEHIKTQEKLVEAWADILYKNMNLDCNEAGYDVWVFKDGTQIWDGYACWGNYDDYEYGSPGYDEHIEKLDDQAAIENVETNAIYEKAVALARLMQENEKKAKAKKLADQKLAQEAAEKEQRMKQYENLKKEFGV